MISTVISELQKIHSGIAGIVSAPTTYPGSLPGAILPCVIVVPGRALTRQLTSGVKFSSQLPVLRKERDYSVRVFVESVGQSDYDVPSQTSITLLDRFVEMYFTKFPLGSSFTELVSVTDSGIMAGGEFVSNVGLTYAGQQYKGFIMTLTIVEA